MLNKLEQFLFYLLLFSIPFQTRKILYYEGWRFNEWQSVSVYFTDLIFVALLILWIFNSFRSSKITNYKLQITNKLKISKSKLSDPDSYLILFIIISAISIKNSSNYLVSSYNWLKLVELAVFYWYLSRYAFAKFGLFNSFLAIMMGGLFQAFIAIVQFLKQSNIGLKYLGESIINGDLLGVASFHLPNGEKVIRAYGTTPHSNVLASFLLLALFASYFIFFIRKNSLTTYYLLFTTYSLILFALFLTFSRVIIFAWVISGLIGIILLWRSGFDRKKLLTIVTVTFAVACLFATLYWPEILSRLTIASDDEGLLLRKYYAGEAVKSDFVIFGVGIGNFVNWLIQKNPMEAHWIYQPVHNIYLLIYSETGILGISAFLLFLFFLFKNSFKYSNRISYGLMLATCFLFIGLFDHLFWTLQQGRLIFWFSLALVTLQLKSDIINES